jgi:hypothetical protein
MPPPLPYFKVNIYPFPLPHFASIFFAYLWSFRWPNYIVTLPRYFSFRLPHLNISTGPSSDKVDKNGQRMWLIKNFSQWNGYNHFRFALGDISFKLETKIMSGFFSKKHIIKTTTRRGGSKICGLGGAWVGEWSGDRIPVGPGQSAGKCCDL